MWQSGGVYDDEIGDISKGTHSSSFALAFQGTCANSIN